MGILPKKIVTGQIPSNSTNIKSILGIETSILSGSLALFTGKEYVHSNKAVVSRSESLLPAIHDLFHDSECSISDLDEIIVSVGPGSFTGIRIGLATALGIASALGLQCVSASTLDAILPDMPDQAGFAAIPLGRDQFGVRYFNNRKKHEAIPHTVEILSSDELHFKVSSNPDLEFHLPYEIVDECNLEFLLIKANVFIGTMPTAVNLCRIAAMGSGFPDLTPVYIRREN